MTQVKRKRAAGAGRKPKGEFSQLTSSLTIRIPEDMRRQLESEAAANNLSVTQALLWHLRQSFNRERDRKRDPALQGLLFLIAQLAERSSGGMYFEKELRTVYQSEWRTDLFNFRAFKAAARKLLDAIEEPPAPSDMFTPKQRKEMAINAAKSFGGGPELIKRFVEIHKSPESYATFVFTNLWTLFVKSHLPMTEDELKMIRSSPVVGRVMEREYYGFQRARNDLALDKTTKRRAEALKKLMERRQ
jgi:hypothetical protein